MLVATDYRKLALAMADAFRVYSIVREQFNVGQASGDMVRDAFERMDDCADRIVDAD